MKTRYRVYMIVNRVDNKVYFGATSLTISYRWSNHKCDMKRKQHLPLYSDMSKFGVDRFEVYELCSFNNEDDAFNVEKGLIRLWENLSLPKYNVSSGGKGGASGVIKKFSEETRERMRLAQTGKKLSEDTKERLSIANSGEKAARAKLTQSKVDNIRLLCATGKYTHEEVANMYGVARSTISKIVDNKTWKF